MTMVSRDAWAGAVARRVPPTDPPLLATVVEVGDSWSSPVRVIGVDGVDNDQYFVKFEETCALADRHSVTTEFVVAEVGRLIDAPICDTTLMLVPDALRGTPLRADCTISSEYVHASRAIAHCDEHGRPQLSARMRDHNAARHVGVYALFDLFYGDDQQWLYDIDNDRSIYSHDHGMYLPPAGSGRWDEAQMAAVVDEPHPLPDDPKGLDLDAIDRVSASLRSLDREQLVAVLERVPTSWQPTDNELETLGWFLERRAPQVADRIEEMGR